MASKTVSVPAISCGHCVATIQRELGELEGVVRVEGDPATKQVTIEWDEARTGWEPIRTTLVEIEFAPQDC